MKKKVLILTVAMALSFAITACGLTSEKKEAQDSVVIADEMESSISESKEAEEFTVVGSIDKSSDEGFTLKLEDDTLLEFEMVAATRILIEEMKAGDKVSVLFMGDDAAEEASARTLLLVEKAE